ncbi:putative membrane protein YeaQ/YmgE (transglycosylase-associated protein family) [Nocardioides marinisabuli]|uniref:Putative membrane protein YeaQ/YmgE (Transglycosylase-associated protein family) n=1 Tax=Nocardioides marinisabuli TaxID=419476 RepID=A0A7Y9F1F5_9ACTN|nr:GlsB/YeaQ/YmgE family stress response membrane protein [Nocardioides marinisabuli]NYD57769.1 putative membrane protein YeaQ/YmgE (transglycosylase-associated protein family) [Nocardioides marinisabuli]
MFNIIGLLVVGLIIGALARLIKPGKQALGLLGTLALGVVGALIGGIVASALGTGDIFELNILGFVVAVVAAVLLIGVAEGMSSKGKARV